MLKTRMNKLIPACLLAAVLLAACGGGRGEGPGLDESDRAVPVKTIRLEPQTFVNYLEVTGTVKARNHIDVVAEEGGTLREVLIDQGRTAEAGNVLAVLENEVLAAGFKQAKAALGQAELDFRSKKVLFEKKAISENEYLTAKYSLDAARASYELARARHEKLSLTAQIGGLVNRRYYDLGAYVNPMMPVFELIDNEKIKIVAGVAERFLGSIEIGTPVIITFDAYPDLEVNSRISYISRSIDPDSRTFDIEVEMPNQERLLAPEMIANLRIQHEEYERRIVIPLDALIKTEEGWHVFVMEDSRARKVRVERLAIYEDRVLVEGLRAGQELITLGQQNLSEGDHVAIKDI